VAVIDPALVERLASEMQIESPRRTETLTGLPRPIPQRPYPGRGVLLQDFGHVLAKNQVKDLEQSLQGIFDFPFAEGFGFNRQPIGNEINPFIKVQVQKDLPFAQSSIYPVLKDPGETEKFFAHVRGYLSDGRHPAARTEVERVYRDLRRYNKDYSLIMQIGTAAGAGYHDATINQALRHAILLESMATVPESADWSVRAMRHEGVLARSNEMIRRHAELATLKAKGKPAGGPLTAEAIKMFQRLLGPSVGLRASRGIEGIPLVPAFYGPDPMVNKAQKTAKKEILAQRSHELRSLATPEAVAADPETKFSRLQSFLESNMDREQYTQVMGDALGTTRELQLGLRKPVVNPESKINAVIDELRSRGYDPLLAERALEHVAQTSKAARSVGAAPGKQRLTKQAIEGGLVSEEKVLRMANEAARKMKPITGGGPKNMSSVLALAAILSAGFMVLNQSEAA
jgi:hypothetical protein